MKNLLLAGLIVSVFIPAGLAAGPAIESVYTDIGRKACKEVVDEEDPNETAYRSCPGVAGFKLFVRDVDNGRQSIDMVPPGKEEVSLEYQEIITREMTHLGNKAEWRVIKKGGKHIPIALIVPVLAHESIDEPEKVTRTFLAVAKITENEVCVTDRIVEGSMSQTKLYEAADSAHKKTCLEAQP